MTNQEFAARMSQEDWARIKADPELEAEFREHYERQRATLGPGAIDLHVLRAMPAPGGVVAALWGRR